MKSPPWILTMLLLLAALAPAAADDLERVRADIRVTEAQIGRLSSEMDRLDRDLLGLRLMHEASGHPRIVLNRHFADVAHLDQAVAAAEAARHKAEVMAGWHEDWSFCSSVLKRLLSEDSSWHSEDLKSTKAALDKAETDRAVADMALAQRLQGGIRVKLVRPEDWAGWDIYPQGRPDDVFAVDVRALERMADKEDLRQIALRHDIKILLALRGHREQRRAKAEARLRELRTQERGLLVEPTPQDVVKARYQGGMSPGLQKALVSRWTALCESINAAPTENSVQLTPVALEVRSTPDGDRATITPPCRVSMTVAGRGETRGSATFSSTFTFEEGKGEAVGVFRGEVEAVSSMQGTDDGRPIQQGPTTSTFLWVARPGDPQGDTYRIYFGTDSVPGFELRRVR